MRADHALHRRVQRSPAQVGRIVCNAVLTEYLVVQGLVGPRLADRAAASVVHADVRGEN